MSALGIESRTQDLRPRHHDIRCVVTNPWQWTLHKKTRSYWSWKLHDSTVSNKGNLVCIHAKSTYGGSGGLTLLRPLLNLGGEWSASAHAPSLPRKEPLMPIEYDALRASELVSCLCPGCLLCDCCNVNIRVVMQPSFQKETLSVA